MPNFTNYTQLENMLNFYAVCTALYYVKFSVILLAALRARFFTGGPWTPKGSEERV
jgi:hypothetical protein